MGGKFKHFIFVAKFYISFMLCIHENRQIISRIAPTPSGFLHTGNAYNFLLTYLYTRSKNGFLYLRIDDYDVTRYQRQYVQNIFDVLEFLGVDYDGGARSVLEFESKFSFKHRFEIYKKELLRLDDTYFCDCTKKTPNAYVDGVYTGLCRDKNLKYEKDKTALRINTNGEIYLGDFVLFKKDDMPSYNFASVVDDELLGVNFIVRGEDLNECSAAQIYLAKKLGFRFFDAKIIHHELLIKDGKKLSKSSNAPAINLKEDPKIYYSLVAKRLKLNPGCADSLSNLLYEFQTKISF
ncbi:glutamate--tRNA ligase family protein [Campylobacter californiensis]|nr:MULTISPECIES: glutamate--tRNA ligase family protein [unclassified Campylobacter]QCD50478.1 glutamyl-queuosine tRNA(Asp) synthetase [Campylobacter sp. RM6914]